MLLIIITVILAGGRRLFNVLSLQLFFLQLYSLESFGALSSSSKTDTSKDQMCPNDHRCFTLHAFFKNGCFDILVDKWVVYSLTESLGLVFVYISSSACLI